MFLYNLFFKKEVKKEVNNYDIVTSSSNNSITPVSSKESIQTTSSIESTIIEISDVISPNLEVNINFCNDTDTKEQSYNDPSFNNEPSIKDINDWNIAKINSYIEWSKPCEYMEPVPELEPEQEEEPEIEDKHEGNELFENKYKDGEDENDECDYEDYNKEEEQEELKYSENYNEDSEDEDDIIGKYKRKYIS
jgi:hypothetical protein